MTLKARSHSQEETFTDPLLWPLSKLQVQVLGNNIEQDNIPAL